MKRPNIQIATYNLLAGKKTEKLLATIKKIAERNPAVFVFQEVPQKNGKSPFLREILRTLGPTFKHTTFFVADAMDLGIMICWNTDIATVRKRSIKKISFPSSQYSLWEKIVQRFIVGLSSVPLKRRALSAMFTVYGKSIRVTNIHLNIEGSWKKRQENLSYLIKQLGSRNSVLDYDIILGDFNTLYTSRRKERQEHRLLKQTLNQKRKPGKPMFVDVTAHIDYTNDALAEYTYPTWLNRLLYTLMHALRLHAYRKLDYIWAKKRKAHAKTTSEVLYESGSDHFPVIATIEL